ncbi:hypothetical protein [Streptomyces sp. SCL15-4]|nr:hypothetical protein [Streptomyces sp. SCL15-4]
MTVPTSPPTPRRPRPWWPAVVSGVCGGIARAVGAWVLGLFDVDSD